MVSMNRLSNAGRARVVGCLVEGMSIRATVRITGVAKNTVTKLLVDLGAACSEYQDGIMQNLICERIEADEIWSFCHSKQRNVSPEHEGQFGYGDVWTWVALDADTKLVPCYLVGERTATDADVFINDLASRLNNRIQLSTDGLRLYINAVERAFGADIDYAVIHKLYASQPRKEGERTYSPAVCTGIEIREVQGKPDRKHISTSYVERQNLTMRMGMRRFTRLTNAFSKKVENLAAAVSLHFAFYNLCRPHKTLSKKYPTTPAMAAGIADHVWTLEELVGLLEASEKNSASN
jgi:IS1 family transposase